VPPNAHRAAISSISVGSSSPLPVLLARLDTGHIRSLSSTADRSSSVPPAPPSQAPKSAGSRIIGMRSWVVRLWPEIHDLYDLTSTVDALSTNAPTMVDVRTAECEMNHTPEGLSGKMGVD
jgi:hypothetical protein